jgi:hypothetical protein
MRTRLEEAKAEAEISRKVREAETAAGTAEFPAESVQESWRDWVFQHL